MKKIIIPVVLVTGMLCLAPVRGWEGRRSLPCANRNRMPERAPIPVELMRWRPDAL